MNTVNTRKKFFPNVTDEEWNDWTWQVKNRIEKIFIDNANLSEFTFDEVIDLEGKYLGPAFIDVHTHGADGADAMDGSEEALRKISAYLVKEGTANFLSTTFALSLISFN